MDTSEQQVLEPINVSQTGDVRSADLADRVATIRAGEPEGAGEGCNGGWGN